MSLVEAQRDLDLAVADGGVVRLRRAIEVAGQVGIEKDALVMARATLAKAVRERDATTHVLNSGGPPGELRVSVGRPFEETVELFFETAGAAAAENGRHFAAEFVIDRMCKDKEGDPAPPPDAIVKKVECGKDERSMVHNMPGGRRFLVAVTADLADGSTLRSKWVRAVTLPVTEALGHGMDPFGNLRGKCLKCPCTGFRAERPKNIHMNSRAVDVNCRGCGCLSRAHELLNDHSCDEAADDGKGELRGDPVTVELPDRLNPKQSSTTSVVESELSLDFEHAHDENLYIASRTLFNPKKMAAKRRVPHPGKSDPRGPPVKGRVSVVCPTRDSRRNFHEQLWAVFNAQTWPDKELVVVETFSRNVASVFLAAKAASDERLIYVPLVIDAGAPDLTIGMKRNMCTYLASGEFVANFDDDDIYAPRYLETMVESMVSQRGDAITLGSWFVFDNANGRCGHVDARKGTDGNSTKDQWLYGWGFSYVFSRRVALEHPYPDQNFGEDYVFFCSLRDAKRWKVALHYDDVGICLHTLHLDSTSKSWAHREVPRDDLLDLEFASLDSVMAPYLRNIPNALKSTHHIGAVERAPPRALRVGSSLGKFEVRVKPGATASDVRQLLASQTGGTADTIELHRASLDADSGELAPFGSLLTDKERIGLRSAELFASFPVDRGIEEELLVVINDIVDQSITVTVRLAHSIVRVRDVLEALVSQHSSRDSAKGMRLAYRTRSATFVSCQQSDWVGSRRQFFNPQLAELLGRKRSDG